MNIGGSDGGVSEDPLAELFYPLYTDIFSDDSPFIESVSDSLAQARVEDNVEIYVSRALGYGVIMGGILWLIGLLFGFVVFTTGIISFDEPLLIQHTSRQIAEILSMLRIPAAVIFSGIVLGTLGFSLTFGAFIFKPRLDAGERKRDINQLLPDTISFMYALSVGGMNQLEIIESVAEAEDTYGTVSEEFQSIMYETTYFDTDYRNAIRSQAEETPSEHLSQFLMDMLAILQSGGDMENFLEDKKDKHLRLAKQQQQAVLDTLELFGEMYMTLSLFPLLLIIILVAMSLLGNASMMMMYGVIYGLIPMIAVGFLVLVSTVQQDEIGSGELELSNGGKEIHGQENIMFEADLVSEYEGDYDVFDEIREAENTYNTLELLQKPHLFFRDNPLYVLALTIPAAIVVLAIALASGSVPTTISGIKENPVWPTFVYVYIPVYMNIIPLAVFHEWNHYHRYAIIDSLSETLRKLASANETGQTLFEAMNTVGESSDGRLAREFRIMYAKIQYGTTINRALVEFNNKYKIPRLARTVKLIAKAQEASNEISTVLQTAAQTSENQDDIERERKSNARMQMVIIIMTYLTLLAVMAILQTQFIEVMAQLVESTGGGGGSGSGGQQAAQAGGGTQFSAADLDPNQLSMLFFHAVTLQAIFSGIIAGYMRKAKLMSGLKYAAVLMTIALGVWMFVG